MSRARSRVMVPAEGSLLPVDLGRVQQGEQVERIVFVVPRAAPG